MNMLKSLHRPIAALTLVALAACSNGYGPPVPSPSTPPSPSAGGGYSQNIVGIGDSLTAGTQSGTTMGAPYVLPAPITEPAPFPAIAVAPPTQPNGWFALFFAQANKIALDPAKYNLDTALGLPSISPLPLIAAPGLGAQLLFGSAGIVATHLGCDTFDNAAYTLNSLSSVRLNPFTKTYDLGVPGITMHEALAMSAPVTGAPPGPVNNTCPNPPYPSIAGDPTAGALQDLVQSESQAFYPVLGSYTSTVKPLTQVSVALSLKPSVTTVWLGANDLLKYVFSNGASPVTDTPAQFQTDLTSIITQLKAVGSKVIVADLPNILETPQFFQGGVPANPAAPSQTVFSYLQIFSQGAISPTEAGGIVAALQAQCGVGSAGYLTETGFFDLLQLIEAGQYNPTSTTCQLVGPGGQSGAGELYLTDAFAAQVQLVNSGYNQIIDSVAASTGSVLVPVTATFNQIYAASNNGSSATPYYYLIPGTADLVSLRFGGKLVGFDGLHPSDTGYALIANVFIGAAEAAGINVANGPLSSATLNAIYTADPYFIPSPFVPNAPMSRRRPR